MTNINRSPQDHWRHAEHAVEIPVIGDVDLAYKRMNESYAEMVRNINTAFYSGDEIEARYVKKPSRFKIWSNRIRDAWQVLLGREHIGGDW